MLEKIKSQVKKKEQTSFVIFSVVFGIIYTVSQIIYDENVGAHNMIQFVLSASIVCIILNLVYKYVKKSQQYSYEQNKYTKKILVILFVVLLISYSIALITYFPGVGMNDGLNILRLGMGASDQFPIFYCAIYKVLMTIGDMFGTYQISVIIYSICQLVIVAAVTAGVLFWLWNKQLPEMVKVIVTVYFAASPLTIMYSFAMLKDTLFSLLLIVMSIFMYELMLEKTDFRKNRIFWCAFIGVMIGVMYLRNNGTYIVAACLIVTFFAGKKYRKQTLGVTVVIVLAIIVNSFAYKVEHIEPMFQEKVGIPLQQIAAVVAVNGEMTEAQAEFINKIMPLDVIKKQYNPETADPLKWDADNFDRQFLAEHQKEFIGVWAQLLPKNFDIYVKAYLKQTYWFWAPHQKGEVQCLFSIENISNNDWLLLFLEEKGIHDEQLLPDGLNSVLRSYYGLAVYFLREGILFWITAVCALLTYWKNKNWKNLVLYLPCFLLWATIMISTPVSLSLRYVFAFVYGLPVFVSMLFAKE